MDSPTDMTESDQQANTLAQECARALWETDTTSQSLGMQLQKVAPGECTITMSVKEKMCNGHGTCHGGYLFTLADSTFAFACNSYNQRAVAQHCSVTFVHPAFIDDVLTACAHEISRVGRSGIYDIAITNQNNIVIAQFRGHSRTIKGQLV